MSRLFHWIPAVVLAGVLTLLALPACAQKPSSPTDVVRIRPQVVVPFMKTPPKIDGVISDGEWPTLHVARFVTNSNQTVQPRYGEFWFGSDGKKLYVAIRSGLNPTYGANAISPPTKGIKDAGVMFGGIFGFVHEDLVDFWVDNHPGQKNGTYYRVAVNPLGAIFDNLYDHVINIVNTGWRADFQQAHTIKDNIWCAEFAFSLKSFQLTDLHKPFAVRINRMYSFPEDYSHWEAANYPYDMPGMGASVPNTMPLVRFSEKAPIVSEVSAQDDHGIDVALDVTNPTDAPLPVQVKLGYSPVRQAREYVAGDTTLQPGETKRFALQRPFAEEKSYTALAEETVTDPEGAIYFTRDFTWQTRPATPLWEAANPTPGHPVAHYEIEFHPTPKVLRWRADISANPAKAIVKYFRVRVVDTASKTTVNEQRMSVPAGYDAIGQMDLPLLQPGRYEAQLFLDTAQLPATAPGKGMVFVYKTDFPWLNNTIGISDEVIPPFTPLTVEGNTVGAILRRHTMTDTGLWAQVVSKEKPILNGPMRLEVKQQGKMQAVHGQLSFTEKKGHRVVAESTWTAGALHGHTISDFDYDGCMKVTLKLTERGRSRIDSLDLVIPLANKLAPLMHESGDSARYNYGGYIPAGDGVVWTSDMASRSALIGTFIPYLWVGGEERGLCWFADSDRDWVVDCSDKTPDIVLERHGDTLNLRLHLIQQSTTLQREHTIVFGLQATPSKPRPDNPNWRTWGFGDGSKFNWQFAGMSNYYGCPGYSLVPLNGDYEIIRKCAEAKKTGKRDDQFADAYIAAHPEWKGELTAGLSAGKCNAVVPYTNLRGDDKSSQEWVVYQDEWKLGSFPAWITQDWMNWGRKAEYTGPATSAGNSGIDFVVTFPKSRRDYMLYCYKKLFENGFDSLYWDNSGTNANPNPVSAGAFVREDGQVQAVCDIWELREIAKRTAVLLHQMGKPNAIMVHMTNAYMVPILSWTTYNLDWEWKGPRDDFQDRVTRDYTRAATMGLQAGTIPAILNAVESWDAQRLPWEERTRDGYTMVHEFGPWGGGTSFSEMKKFLYSFGYGTPACKVYNYWDDNPVVKIDGLDAAFLALDCTEKGKVILVVTDFGDGGNGQVTLNVQRLGLPADFVAVNRENPRETLQAKDGKFSIIALKQHDYRIFVIDK